MKLFEKISQLFQSTDVAVQVANLLDKAYADGTGNPDWYAEFGSDKPEQVAINLAGLYAADTAANLIARMRGVVDEDGYRNALKAVVEMGEMENPDFNRMEVFVALNCANLAWRAGQPFRGIEKDPLDRITRDVNAQFMTLPNNEVDKDLIQVTEAANFLLKMIS